MYSVSSCDLRNRETHREEQMEGGEEREKEEKEQMNKQQK